MPYAIFILLSVLLLYSMVRKHQQRLALIRFRYELTRIKNNLRDLETAHSNVPKELLYDVIERFYASASYYSIPYIALYILSEARKEKKPELDLGELLYQTEYFDVFYVPLVNSVSNYLFDQHSVTLKLISIIGSPIRIGKRISSYFRTDRVIFPPVVSSSLSTPFGYAY